MEAVPSLGIRRMFIESIKTMSGIAAFAMLGVLILAVATLPFYAPGDVARRWNDLEGWTDNPRNAAPEWMDYFTGRSLARSLILDYEDFRKATSDPALTLKVILHRGFIDWQYDTFPSEISMSVSAEWVDKVPNVRLIWQRPDGLSLTLMSFSPANERPATNSLSISRDSAIIQTVRDWALDQGARDVQFVQPEVALFAEANEDMMTPRNATVLKGQYTFRVETIALDQEDDVDVRLRVLGVVHGLAGTDTSRRDLLVGLLWGAPVALAFGVVAALVTVFSQVFIGVFSAYFGGRWDEIAQRFTDFFLIIPILPILILFGAFYSPGILTILLIVIVFSLVGSSTKVVRSIALQVKEEQYVELARSYGSSRLRIVFRHILPRTMPYAFALVALAVPSFIFLEAALSFLGLGDPLLPTWGAMMGEASQQGALLNGLWWWITFPALGILFTTVAFALLGYSFDKVLNPRLREE